MEQNTRKGAGSPGRTRGLAALAAAVLWLAAGGWLFLAGEGRVGATPVPRVLVFGDSIQAREEAASISAILEEMTGWEVGNAAFGGSAMARFDPDWDEGKAMDQLSMVSLARSIAAGDFSVQKNLHITDNATEYFGERVEYLSQVDVSRVEWVVIAHGVNDYHSNTPLEILGQPQHSCSYAGALRRSVQFLREKNARLRILLAGPLYSWYPHRGSTGEDPNGLGLTLEDYRDKMQEVARELGVEFLDQYALLDRQAQWQTYTLDGLHLNQEGKALVAAAWKQVLQGK